MSQAQVHVEIALPVRNSVPCSSGQTHCQCHTALQVWRSAMGGPHISA